MQRIRDILINPDSHLELDRFQKPYTIEGDDCLPPVGYEMISSDKFIAKPSAKSILNPQSLGNCPILRIDDTLILKKGYSIKNGRSANTMYSYYLCEVVDDAGEICIDNVRISHEIVYHHICEKVERQRSEGKYTSRTITLSASNAYQRVKGLLAEGVTEREFRDAFLSQG